MLTEREREIYELVCQHNLSKRQIARNLNLSEKTIKFHLHNIYSKMNVKERADLIFNYWRERESRN